MKKSKLYSIEESVVERIEELTSTLNLNKSEVVEYAINEVNFDLDKEIIDLNAERVKKIKEIGLINKRLKEIEKLKKSEQIEIKSLIKKKTEFKKNIKRKFDEGKELEGVNIAKRVSHLVKCNYLELLPK